LIVSAPSALLSVSFEISSFGPNPTQERAGPPPPLACRSLIRLPKPPLRMSPPLLLVRRPPSPPGIMLFKLLFAGLADGELPPPPKRPPRMSVRLPPPALVLLGVGGEGDNFDVGAFAVALPLRLFMAL